MAAMLRDFANTDDRFPRKPVVARPPRRASRCRPPHVMLTAVVATAVAVAVPWV
jgi:hypothetical protein